MRDAVVVSAVRTAVGKAPKGTLRATRPDDLGAAAIQGALANVEINLESLKDSAFVAATRSKAAALIS